jgi:hypothetical protein
MATYADMQARIIAETNRDDLADDLASALTRAIQRAIEFYADTRFWFNEFTQASVCTPQSEYVNQPTGLRKIDRLSVQVGANSYGLKSQPFTKIDELARAMPDNVGQPTDYATFGYQVRLWRMPNIAYPLNFIGIADLSALVKPTDANAWTNEAQDLIAARARYVLYRDQFRDPDGAATAHGAELEELGRLNHETAKRLGTGRVRPSW